MRTFVSASSAAAHAAAFASRLSARTLLMGVVALLAAGCGSREVEKDLRVTNVETGWYDAGIVDGQNKIVPSITFHLENVSDDPIENVQINAVFHRMNEEQAWGDRLIRGIGSEGLGAGETGDTLVIRSSLGYTGIEPRAQMLQNQEFIDAKVNLFARHGSRTWAKIGEFPIERRLITGE